VPSAARTAGGRGATRGRGCPGDAGCPGDRDVGDALASLVAAAAREPDEPLFF